MTIRSGRASRTRAADTKAPSPQNSPLLPGQDVHRGTRRAGRLGGETLDGACADVPSGTKEPASVLEKLTVGVEPSIASSKTPMMLEELLCLYLKLGRKEGACHCHDVGRVERVDQPLPPA